jgi:hypothetical protein
MKRTLFAIAAGLLLALPAACAHPGYGPHGGPGGPGGPGCPKQQGCGCKCRQQPDCPQHRQQEPPPPAK